MINPAVVGAALCLSKGPALAAANYSIVWTAHSRKAGAAGAKSDFIYVKLLGNF